MMETGETGWLKAVVPLIMRMAMSIKENFYRIEQMGMEYMFIPMARNMKEIGEMICKRDMEKNFLKMEVSTLVLL